ncbi:hypothetical protein GYH30_033567 [Glycine max]|uniref:Uncharacterized protein n=2 Tax=Glycine subgen. Soja TaxID=1462606 RepID=A0A0R0HH40_SOYBN|nr:hypothetical protein GYH30_033567 [Glycine max]RZB75601.1 hypothetical protein D0Y65_034189 [Glycine soja]
MFFRGRYVFFNVEFDYFRDDITFKYPLNTFTSIEKYKLIFWSLRFHGKILFREIALEVYRIWQPLENVILIRWNLRDVPQVPWEAKGKFQVSVLDLVTACPASPNLTFSWGPLDSNSSSWLEFYQAVKYTVDQEERLLPQECMATCS